MPKSDTLRRIDQSQRSDYLVDRDSVDPSETTTPNVPEGVSVKAVSDGVLIEVDLNTDTAHLHARFESFIVYARPVNTVVVDGSGQEVGRIANGQNTMLWQPEASGYTAWEIALTAISNTGYESAKTAWHRTVVSTFYDDFSSYGGQTITSLEDLYWLQQADADSDESWSEELGTLAAETSNYLEGDQGIKVTVNPGDIGQVSLAVSLDMSNDGRFTDSDYVLVPIYPTLAGTPYFDIRYYTATPSDYYKKQFTTSLVSGAWNYLSVKKSDFSTSGSPAWSNITSLQLILQDVGGGGVGTYIFDTWHIIKADPDDAAALNPTGTQWDFSDGTWIILPGNRTGEPTYDHSLAQIEMPADDDYFATIQNVAVPNGRISGGFLFFGADGRGGATFRVEDDTLGSEEALAAEIDTSTDTIYLVRYTAGSKSTLASASYTVAPDAMVWIAVDFRDPDHENRINIHVGANEWDLWTADSMKISHTLAAPWPDGNKVGVVNHACNMRINEIHAGSPRVADFAYRASVALRAINAVPGTMDHGVLSGLADDDHTQYLLLAGETTDAQLHSGADLIVYSDAGSTEVARIDGATGNITTSGTVDGVDVAGLETAYGAHDHSAADPTQVDHANLTNVSADQHHAGFIGLEDNAATAITPAADDRIQVTDDGVVNADAAGNTLALSIAQAQIDHGTIGGLTDDDHSGYLQLAGRSGGQSASGGTASGDDLTLNSTAHATKGFVLLNTGGGNVGIGTATPDSTLEVAGGTAVLKVASTTDATDAAIILERVGTTRLDWRLLDTAGNFHIQSSADEGASWTDRVFVGADATYAGRVGIGTITPGNKLHVVGTTGDTYSAYVYGDTSTGGLKVEAGSSADTLVALEVLYAGGSTPILRARSNGFVYIGTTTAVQNAALTVNGGVAGDFFTTDTRAWYLAETALNLDFTGTNYDTKAECNAVGLRFSDSDTPFPTVLGDITVSGTWTHSAGNGWQPAVTTDYNWCVILIPLMRPGNWQLTYTINYTPTDVAHQISVEAGYITQSNHVGAKMHAYDASGAANQLTCELLTNNASDAYDSRYTGSALSGTGSRTYGFRCQNGTVSAYDEQDDNWHPYAGKQSAGIAYTPAYAFVAAYKYAGATLCQAYLSNITLTYLL